MDGWVTFWAALLIVALLLFGGIAVVVAVGGFRDIRSMLRRIQEQHAKEESDSGEK